MRTFSAGRVVVLGSLVAVWTILAACTVEEENPGTARNRGTGSTLDGSASGEGGQTVTPTGAPLCGKYGGPDGIKSIAQTIIVNSKSDCRISPTVTNAERERGVNFTDCFTQFVQGGFQCPGVSFSLGQTKDTKDKVCNSQMPGVQFSELDFDTFLSDVKLSLEAKGLSADDVRAIAPVFEGARLKLVVDPSKTTHRQCAAVCAPGGEACPKPVLDAGNDGQPPTDAGNDTGPTPDPDAGDGG